MEVSACARLVRAGDPDRFRACFFAESETREWLFALYAFNLELARAAYVVSEPMLGEIRLQWWRDAIGEIYAGGAVRQHEIVVPLAEAIRETVIPRQLFERMIEARRIEVHGDAMLGWGMFETFVADTAGALMQAAATIESTDTQAAGHVGWAQGAAALLKAIPAHAALGRVMLPPEAGLDRAAIIAGEGESARAAVHRIAEEGLHRLEMGRSARGAAFMPAWDAARILRLARAPGVDPLRDFTERSEFARLAIPLWRGMRGRW